MMLPDLELLAVAFAAYFVAGLVKGTTGLGFSTTCLPLIALAFGLHRALPLVILPSLAANLMVMRQVGGFGVAARRFWPLYVASLPGLALGLYLLGTVNRDYPALALGVVLILYALHALARPPRGFAAAYERALAAPTGFVTGLVNGLTGSQVMPVLPFLMALKLPPGLFLQAINISFTLSSLIMLAGLAQLRLVTVEALVISALGLAPAAAGIALGGRLRARLPEDAFRKAVLGVLIVLGLALLARSYPA